MKLILGVLAVYVALASGNVTARSGVNPVDACIFLENEVERLEQRLKEGGGTLQEVDQWEKMLVESRKKVEEVRCKQKYWYEMGYEKPPADAFTPNDWCSDAMPSPRGRYWSYGGANLNPLDNCVTKKTWLLGEDEIFRSDVPIVHENKDYFRKSELKIREDLEWCYSRFGKDLCGLDHPTEFCRYWKEKAKVTGDKDARDIALEVCKFRKMHSYLYVAKRKHLLSTILWLCFSTTVFVAIIFAFKRACEIPTRAE
jgi:hypothetical protein